MIRETRYFGAAGYVPDFYFIIDAKLFNEVITEMFTFKLYNITFFRKNYGHRIGK